MGRWICGSVLVLLAVTACGGKEAVHKPPPSSPRVLSTAQIARIVEKSTVEIYGQEGSQFFGGTGVVIDAPKGLVLTNAHVIAGLATIHVQHETDDVIARVVGSAPCDDVAVIRMSEPIAGLTALGWAASARAVRAGQQVIALGFPTSLADKPDIAKPTVTEGIISVDGIIGGTPSDDLPHYNSVIQHTAAINPGNSGGPLVNRFGKLLGINSLSASGSLDNQAYAITVDHIKSVLPALKAGKRQVYVGWDLLLVSQFADTTAKSLGWTRDPEGEGLAVLGVDPGSPAERRNIEADDYIAAINGTKVNSVADVCEILASHEGEVVNVAGNYMTTTGEAWVTKLIPK